MSKNKQRILIIDDSTDDIHFVMENLKQHYAILVATSGKKGIALAQKEPQPDVILLDVMMPEMDGYETCRQLKNNPLTKNIDVIFISAHHDIAEKLKGYDVGGRDYLSKPVQPEELLTKVKLSLQNIKTHLQMQENALKIAHNVMSTGDFEIIINFIRNWPLMTNIEMLAKTILTSMASYNLESSIQIRCEATGDVNLNLTQAISQIELDIFAHYKDKNKIIERRQGAIFNFDRISLMIKNMPHADGDDDKRSRLRDNISILLDASVGMLTVLRHNIKLQRIISESQETLKEIEIGQEKYKQKSQSIMDEMLSKIQDSFDFWGLTEEQEKMMLTILHQGVDSSIANAETGLVMDKQLRKVFQNIFDVVK